MTTIYVGNLPASADPETLESVFRRYGDVTGVELHAEESARRRSCYGLVEMPARDAARRASRLLNGQLLGGRFIHVSTMTPPVLRDAGGSGVGRG